MTEERYEHFRKLFAEYFEPEPDDDDIDWEDWRPWHPDRKGG